MIRAYIGLGANLGRPVEQLQWAKAAISRLPGSRRWQASSLYQTAPWGLAEQPDFINAVLQLDTELAPRPLLAELQQLEVQGGRVRNGVRWGPRLLDLDILHIEGVTMDAADLTLPHPRMVERAFVLLPLHELAPDLELPGHGRVADLLAGLDTTDCQRLREPFRD